MLCPRNYWARQIIIVDMHYPGRGNYFEVGVAQISGLWLCYECELCFSRESSSRYVCIYIHTRRTSHSALVSNLPARCILYRAPVPYCTARHVAEVSIGSLDASRFVRLVHAAPHDTSLKFQICPLNASSLVSGFHNPRGSEVASRTLVSGGVNFTPPCYLENGST